MAYTPPPLPYHGPVAHTSGTGNLPINRLVIHCTAGSDAKGAQGTAAYFRDPASKGSAHYITDSDEAIQCARDDVVCWHAPPNTHSLGIEMECSLAGQGNGHWARADHIAMMKITAKLTAQKAVQYNVPITKLTPADLAAGKRGICGHHDVSQAFGQSSHWDPGPYFPWAQFMAWVRAEAAAITGSTPTPPKGDDVQLSDPVGPDRSDPKTPLTLGEAANRGGYAYWAIRPGGDIFKLIQAQDGEISALKARLAKLEGAPKA
jgi:hypothetical protein